MRDLEALLILIVLGGLCMRCGAATPSTVQSGVAGVELALCIMNVAKHDAGKPTLTVVADAVNACGTDAATVIRLLDGAHALNAAEKYAADAGSQ